MSDAQTAKRDSASGKRRSLRVELIAVLAVLLTMAVASLSLTAELVGARRYQAQQLRQLEEHTRGLAALVAPLLGGATAAPTATAEVEQALRPSIGSQGIVAIEVYRQLERGAEPIASLGLSPPLPPPAPAPDGEGLAERTRDGLLVVDRPLQTFGPETTRPRLVLRVVARPSAWTRLGDWQEILILALGVGAVLLVLGVLLLELQVLRPLSHIRSGVARLALGDLKTRVPEEGPAELQSLAAGFNQMSAALAARIEEIEAQRERLVRAEQLASVGRVAAGIAHEVGNPLAAILGYVELLLDPRTDPPVQPDQRELLERSRQQLLRIQTIVGQLLEYSRPARHAPTRVDVLSQTRQLMELLKHDPRCEGVSVRVEGEEVSARADPALLDQILHNLVINGARAAREVEDDAPEVVVRVSGDEQRVTLEVQDSGPGIDPSARPRLFEPFYTTAPAGEGTGLGLAICQGLVETMDGTLTCLPDRSAPALPGHAHPGAVFRVTLPRAGASGPQGDNAPKNADNPGRSDAR